MELLTTAFCTTLPFSVWLYPEEADRRKQFVALFSGLVAKAGTQVDVVDGLGAVALWEPPAAAEGVMAAAGEAPAPEDGSTKGRPEVAQLFAAVEAAKPKPAGGWYLGFLGSTVKGGGGALLRHRLAELDAIGAPATLWTPNEALLPVYERFGFRLLSRHDVPGASAFWMLRDGCGASASG